MRDDCQVALLMLDADHFKQFNDSRGHLAGDDALKEIAKAMQGSIRTPADFVARFGGEEFVVILPATDAEGALGVAEGMRVAIEALSWNLPGAGQARLTVSIGVATARPPHFGNGSDLIAHADRALYAAKRGGRNRVSFARETALTACLPVMSDASSRF